MSEREICEETATPAPPQVLPRKRAASTELENASSSKAARKYTGPEYENMSVEKKLETSESEHYDAGMYMMVLHQKNQRAEQKIQHLEELLKTTNPDISKLREQYKAKLDQEVEKMKAKDDKAKKLNRGLLTDLNKKDVEIGNLLASNGHLLAGNNHKDLVIEGLSYRVSDAYHQASEQQNAFQELREDLNDHINKAAETHLEYNNKLQHEIRRYNLISNKATEMKIELVRERMSMFTLIESDGRKDEEMRGLQMKLEMMEEGYGG
ncbi:uncharacterized protein LTR77_002266 [Saxophila tyrrhenica]|uniref:Uncharacterized protein n=1 Tax=Saxophila tyrrhenica TaxID=1690608 RepID=A0AAV9PIP3_9PEZI|nr:hypothetical protein LTR77_002266 [Saxophila tyrrhenica]